MGSVCSEYKELEQQQLRGSEALQMQLKEERHDTLQQQQQIELEEK